MQSGVQSGMQRHAVRHAGSRGTAAGRALPFRAPGMQREQNGVARTASNRRLHLLLVPSSAATAATEKGVNPLLRAWWPAVAETIELQLRVQQVRALARMDG